MKTFTILAILITAASVSAQLQVKDPVGNTVMIVTQGGQVGIGTSTPTAGTVLDINGIARMSGLRLATSSAGQVLVAPGTNGTATWGTVGSVGVTDNSLTAQDLAVNVVSSINSVVNDGSNIDITAGNGIVVTPNNSANTINVALSANVIGIPAISPWSSMNPLTFTTTGQNIISASTLLQPGTYLLIWPNALQYAGTSIAGNPPANGGWLRLYKSDLSKHYGGLHVGAYTNFSTSEPGSNVFVLTEATNVVIRQSFDFPSGASPTLVYWGSGSEPLVYLIRLK
ncbi:hypothetical protein JW992_05460 [candidate division KSB1 bacterium]|nr:hypothetical protein [candidate division KSB1 bacterium]